MRASERLVAWSGLALCCSGLWAAPSQAADLQEMIRRGNATIQSDWAADADYAYVERDEVQKDEALTSKTYQVVLMDGSDYNLPIALNDQTLSPDQQKIELEKLKRELRRRQSEGASARQQRIATYQKQRDENGALLLEFPKAFTYELAREETLNGYPAYVFLAAPVPDRKPTSRAAKVLAGMRGTLWIDKENFHVIRAECTVVTPVPVYGLLARVLPGTHVSIELAPVSDSAWLIRELTMKLTVAKFFWFKSTQSTRSTFSEYRLNTAVLDELLSRASP